MNGFFALSFPGENCQYYNSSGIIVNSTGPLPTPAPRLKDGAGTPLLSTPTLSPIEDAVRFGKRLCWFLCVCLPFHHSFFVFPFVGGFRLGLSRWSAVAPVYRLDVLVAICPRMHGT